MTVAQELCKFGSGFESFHALANAYFWLSGARLELFGVSTTPELHLMSAVVNGGIAIALAIFAWRQRPTDTGSR